MTCRHVPGDPNCSSNRIAFETARDATARVQALEKEVAELKKKKFTIEDVEEVGSYLILTVRFPFCDNCAFDSRKLLLYRAGVTQAVLWTEIDPHFREPDKVPNLRRAPPPLARFPASAEGRKNAKLFLEVLRKT